MVPLRAGIQNRTGGAFYLPNSVEDPACVEVLVPPGLPFNLAVLFLALRFARFARLRLRLPTSWRGALCRFLEPFGRPGPGLEGLGRAAGVPGVSRTARNPRRTRA